MRLSVAYGQHRLLNEGSGLMVGIRQYLINIIVVAIIVSVLSLYFGKKSTIGAIIRLLGGIILFVTVLSPLTKIQLQSWQDFYGDIFIDASDAATHGQEMAVDAATAIIKEELEAYIQDKAVSMQLQVDVRVDLTDTYPPTPDTVTIIGGVSPYAKKLLGQFLAESIGIPEENQIWN